MSRRRYGVALRSAAGAAGPWGAWPALARASWLFARPLLALGAVVSLAMFASAAFWLAALGALATLSVRSARSPLPPAIVAAAIAAISPLAGVLLATRLLLSEATLRYLGRGGGPSRAKGLSVVAAARLAFARSLFDVSVPGLEQARREFGLTLSEGGEDTDAVLERALAYAFAAWANWRWLELLALLKQIVRGLLSGQWSSPSEGAELDLLFLSISEELLTGIARWLSLAVAAGTAFALGGGVDAPLLGGGLGGRCAAALATLLIAMPLSARPRGFAGAAIATALAWWLTGGEVWEPIAIAVAAGAAVGALRPRVERLNLAGRMRWRRWPPPPGTPRRLRPHWRAASKAAAAGDERTALELFGDLARDREATDRLFVAALGRAALLEIDLGRFQDAAGHLDEISEREDGLSGVAAVAAGMLALELGDLARAEALLSRALEELGRSSPLAPRATLALSDALARKGEPDRALELVARLRSRPFAIRGLAASLETQLAIAEALVRAGEGERAADLLDELDGLSDVSDLPLGDGPEGRRRMHHAAARALTLRGRLLLDANASRSVALLERAVAMAADAGDGALLATAETLLGAAQALSGQAETGVRAIATGVEALEARRVQLRASARRGALIVAAESLYSAALRGLCAAQAAGEEGAGPVAAELIESLRKSALAETLRTGPLPIDSATSELIERIRVGEEGGAGELDRLHSMLREQISARFADAYLPRRASADRLREVARSTRHHVLSFYVPPSGLPGWRVWIRPSGEIEVDRVGPDASEEGDLLAALATDGALPPECLHEPLLESAGAWERLAGQLIPKGLREHLSAVPPERPEPVLVVPDGVLALVPWAALHVGGRPLVEMATVQTAPAQELVGVATAASPSERVIAHLSGDDGELDPLRVRSAVQVVGDREKFLEGLRSQLFDGAYMASHGDRTGLRQRIEFADGSTLSAATALAIRWPSWAVFGSCLVGRVEQAAGHEPFGLAISCMLRGADTVAASVVELTDEGATACGELAAGLAGGGAPAQVLREAQLRQLRRRRLISLADGLGLICISGGASPGRDAESQARTQGFFA